MAGTDQRSAVFSALPDPTRRTIIAEPAAREATAADLTAPSVDLDAGGVTAPESARARRAHLAVAVGQVAREPFETGLRVESYDEADGRTRLEISQCPGCCG